MKNMILEKVISTLPDTVILTDIMGEVIFVSRQGLEVSGYRLDQLVGHNMLEFIDPSDHERIIENNIKMMERKLGPKEYTLILSDGKPMPIEVNGDVIRDETGEPSYRIISLRDISNRKEMENLKMEEEKRRALQQNAIYKFATDPVLYSGDLEKGLGKLTEIVSDALDATRTSIWFLSEDGGKLECQDLYDRREGKHSRGQILRSVDYPEYFKAFLNEMTIGASDAHRDDRTLEFAENYLKPNGIVSMMDSAVHGSGRVIGVVCNEIVGKKRMWRSDEISFSGIFADQVTRLLIEKERKTYSNMLKLERDRARFYLDMMRHDIGNLHQGILSSIQMSKQRSSGCDCSTDLLDIAEETVHRSMALVKNIEIISMLKEDRKDLEKIDIVPLLKNSLNSIDGTFPSKNVEVEADLGNSPIHTFAEPIVQQLFFNLIHNGIKHHFDNNARIKVVARKESGKAVVEVIDHGNGINDERKDEILKSNRESMDGLPIGSGTGLHIVKALLERYDGDLEICDRIEGDHSQGSRFIVRLPLVQ